MKENHRTLVKTLIPIAIVVPIGFCAKYCEVPMARWINTSSGGIFYEIFWCLLISVFVQARPSVIAGWVLIATCCLEFLQLWHPVFLEWLRSFFIGRTILGTTFDWWDFPHYFIGSGIGWLWLRKIRNRKD